MSGGRSSPRKGARIERQLVDMHRDLGVRCNRVPLSGAVAGFKGDLKIHLFHGEPLTAEVKARASGEGFATLTRWLGDADLLILRQDRTAPMVCLPWLTWAKVVEAMGQH